MGRPARVHYLRGNARESSPHRLLVIDTESYWEREDKRELHTLRLWVARLIRRHETEPEEPRTQDFWGLTAVELAELVEASLQAEATTWVYAHNLSFDLGLTRLPVLLAERKFELGQHNLASEAPWAYLKKGRARLRLADSASWLPVSVERLGELLELRKPKLPAYDAPLQTWLRRCQADVHITATAICRVLDEWDRRRLGYWSLTGPSTGWNSLRHMIAQRPGAQSGSLVHRRPGSRKPTRHAEVVIDPDPVAREFERQALYSGRRDLWRVGQLPKGPYVELDLRTAHLAICANFPLPLRRQARFESLALHDWRLHNRMESLLARCLVRTETPRYPLHYKEAILHPVGQFWTTLAGPELNLARVRGDLLEIGPGYAYHVGYFMQPWARWALGILDESNPEADPLLQVMVKGWSRTVPGRWGMLRSRQINSGPSHVREWGLEPCVVGRPARKGFIFHFAGEWFENVRDTEAEDSFPAVLAHIQAWTRLLLGRLIEAIPQGCRVSANTEGVWVHEAALDGLDRLQPRTELPGPDSTAQHAAALTLLDAAVAPLAVQIKQRTKHLRLLSPQHLELDGATHFAGVPGSAEVIGNDRFEFYTWPKLNGQLARGDPRGYVRERRRVDLSGLPTSRWTYADGCAEPARIAQEATDAAPRLLAPDPTCPGHGARLRPLQHPALRGFV